MHNAPSVSYPVGRSRFAAALLGAAWLAGAGATALWWLQPATTGWRVAAAAAAVLAAGAAAAWHWLTSPRGTLAWDGEAWAWSAGANADAGEIGVALDLQRCMLLVCANPRAPRWLWVERAASPPRWADLRRAVYSRAKAPVARQAKPPAANT